MSVPEQKRARELADPDLDAVRRFLYEHVENLEELAVLAALRARPDEGFVELDTLVRATELPRASVEEALARLQGSGSVARPSAEVSAFALVSDNPEAVALLDRLIAEYQRNPIQIMAFLTSNAIERVRGAAHRAFADSLRSSDRVGPTELANDPNAPSRRS